MVNRKFVRMCISPLSPQDLDVSAIGGVLQESALMWAARQGHMTIIVDLLQVCGYLPIIARARLDRYAMIRCSGTWFISLSLTAALYSCIIQQQSTCVSQATPLV